LRGVRISVASHEISPQLQAEESGMERFKKIEITAGLFGNTGMLSQIIFFLM
jgi:hypothetical protein